MSEPLPLCAGPRRLGSSALEVSPLAYGLWRFVDEALARARARIECALEAGYQLFDVADVYGLDWGGSGFGACEALLGRVLAEAPALRDRMVLATKGGITPGVPYDSSPARLRAACEDSLRRLGVERVDLYQIHRPDLLAHPAEVAATLSALREAGKVREVGVSNFTPAQFAALQAHLPFPLATHQPELSAWCQTPLFDGLLDQCTERGVTPLAWSPLAGGRLLLSPDAARAAPEGERLAAVIDTLDSLAAREGVGREAVALAFVLAHPSGAIPIVGSQREDRIRSARDAFRVRLTRRDWYGLVEARRGEPLP